jgi:hypothetical protein
MFFLEVVLLLSGKKQPTIALSSTRLEVKYKGATIPTCEVV